MLGGVGAGRQPNGAIEVGHDEGGCQPDASNGHEEGDEDLQRGQDEHEEGDVQAELRVSLTEGRCVQELQESAPLCSQAGAGRDTEEKCDSPEREAAYRRERLLVAAQSSGGLTARGGSAMPVRVGHGKIKQTRGNQQTNGKEADVGSPLGEDDARGVHLTEPENLCPHDGCQVDNRCNGNQRDRGNGTGARLT